MASFVHLSMHTKGRPGVSMRDEEGRWEEADDLCAGHAHDRCQAALETEEGSCTAPNNVLKVCRWGMGGMAAKGQSMVGGREVAQIKRARPVVRRTVSRCPGRPSTGSSRALDASRLDRGGRGRGSRHNRLHSVAFCPLCSPLRRHWWPGGRRCGSVGERWEWVCCERGTKAEPLLLLLLHGKTAAGLPLLPLPALPALPLAIDLVQAIIRVLGPCPERAFSAVDFVADAIVTLQYRRPQCSTPRGRGYSGLIMGQFSASSGPILEWRIMDREAIIANRRRLSMCRAPAPVHVDCRTDGAAIQTAGLVQQTWPARHATRDGIVRVQTETKCFRHPPSHPHHTRRRWPFC